MKLGWLLAGAGLLGVAVPAAAQDGDRKYCPDRPGLNTPPCVVSPGRVSLETAIADWTRDENADARNDTVLIGDSLVRVGVTDHLELTAGWTPFSHSRSRDKTSGAVTHASGVGDVALGFKENLHHPDGEGLSYAVGASVTLPTASSGQGAGTWSAAFIAPVAVPLSEKLNLAFTPEIDAAANESGSGRHLAYSGTVGLGIALSDAVTFTIEGQALRDRDPAGHTTQRLAAASLAWQAGKDTQFDVGGDLGLDRDTPDHELYLGISHRF